MINSRQIGDTIPLELVRIGAPLEVEMTLNSTVHDLTVVPGKIYDTPPEYFIFGGAVFLPLTLNYLEEWESDWHLYSYDYQTFPYLFDNWRT